jgi:hypothetical protein
LGEPTSAGGRGRLREALIELKHRAWNFYQGGEFGDMDLENAIAGANAALATPLNPSPCCLGVVEALEKLEAANEAVASRRSVECYEMMLKECGADLLIDLGNARQAARTALQSHRGDAKGPSCD